MAVSLPGGVKTMPRIMNGRPEEVQGFYVQLEDWQELERAQPDAGRDSYKAGVLMRVAGIHGLSLSQHDHIKSEPAPFQDLLQTGLGLVGERLMYRLMKGL
jgi:hypothetical protein